ncbi:SDR family oxidoreductase [uncultured Sphingomonas sp.]|uniref:SDR family oxidoreductase n=1 Tax=uncultured Sphingomonas sp. TaxID=158754 RepID=UPI0035CAE463
MIDQPRIALITGANKGIGREVARQLGHAGLHVLLGARDLQAGEATAAVLVEEGVDTRAVHIDLDDPAGIAALAASIDAEHGRLDILVNNAGIVAEGDGPPETADLAAARRIFEVNFFGTLAVTQAMLPLLRRGRSPRIVNVSSSLGSIALNADPAWQYAAVKLTGYNASKAALNMLTVQLAATLSDVGIKVNAANPGYTATDLNGHAGHQTIEQGAEAAVRLALLPDDGPTGGFFSADGPEPWGIRAKPPCAPGPCPATRAPGAALRRSRARSCPRRPPRARPAPQPTRTLRPG